MHYHLIGIGGAGMSGIAEVLINLGYRVSGSDLALNAATRKVELTAALNMVRANTEPRSSHTHHVRMIDGEPTAIANGLHLPLQGSAAPREMVPTHLREREALLLLDNFEHLLAEGGAELETDVARR